MPIPDINEIRIETSTACNAGCVFCPWPTDDFTRAKRIMSLDEYKFYIDKAIVELGDKLEETTVSGFGEAFVDKTIVDKIRYAAERGLGVHILTNGSMMTTEMVDEIYEIGVLDLRFSLHTINPLHYDKIMNYSNKKFELAEVLKIVDYAIAKKPNKTDVIVTADIVDINKDDIDDLIAYFDGRCYLEVWAPHNWVDWQEYRSKGEPNVHDTCGRPFNGPIQLQIEGDIIMCCFDFDNKMVLGNLKHQSLEEIYSGDMFNKIAHHHLNGTCASSDLICKDCDQLKDKGDIMIFNNRRDESGVDRVTTSLERLEVEL